MWFKRNTPVEPEIVEPETAAPRRKLSRLWTDGFGFTATRSLQMIIIAVLLIAVLLGLHRLTLVVIPVLIAIILASALNPVMGWLRSLKIPSALATVIVLLGVVGVFALVGWLIVVQVRDQFDELAERAQQGFEQVLSWLDEVPFAPTPEQLDEWQAAVIDFVTSASFGSSAIAGVSAVTSFVTGLVLMIVILFFFLKDGREIWLFLIRPFEGANRRRAKRVGAKVSDTLGSYVRGTATVAAADAVGIGIGLWILGVPLALPLSVLVFFLSFIPLVGATLAGVLAALVALVSNGFVNALLVVGVVVLVNQLEGNFLQPVLMGRTLKLHPLVILVALTVGTVVGGILGAILAVPITAVVWGVIQVWDGKETPASWARRHPEEG